MEKPTVHQFFKNYLSENYEVQEDDAHMIAKGMEHYFCEYLMPTIISDNRLKEK